MNTDWNEVTGLSEQGVTTWKQERLVWLFLVVGLLLRLGRYLIQFPLWEDECFLCANLIDRGYFELLEPLQYHQVAPVLFLWVQLTFVKLFGYHEFGLRLFPFLCSIGSLFLFRHVALRLLSGYGLVFAMGIFAVAYPNLRYAAEAKQYASNLFVGLIFLAVCLEWWRAFRSEEKRERDHSNRWLWGLTCFTPFALGLSYPAVFSAGAASLFVAGASFRDAWSEKRSVLSERSLVPWLVFNGVMVGSFLVVLTVAARGQSNQELDWMGEYWGHAFPPLSQPLELPMWLLGTHAGSLVAFPIGGEHGASALTFVSLVAGVVLVCRRRLLVGLLLFTPALLHLIAAGMHRYPYGGHVKFSMHMGAMICLVAGLGTAWIMSRLGQWLRVPQKCMAFVVIYLLLIGAGSLLRDVAYPYKTESDMRARAFARWFWFESSFKGEVADVEDDLGVILTPAAHEELNWGAMYRVNRAIYAPDRVGNPNYSRVSHDWPLRCLIYRVPHFEFDQARYEEWLSEMSERYELVSKRQLEFPRFGKRETSRSREAALTLDVIEVLTFVPRLEG